MQPPSAQPPPPEDVDRFYATLLRALAKSPRLIGLTFRGHQEAIEGAAKGAVVSTGLVATSRDPRVATLNGTITSLYAVLGDLGAQLETISQAPQEREVVFLPSTLFVIGMTEHIAGFDVTYVEQINPDRDPPVSARPGTVQLGRASRHPQPRQVRRAPLMTAMRQRHERQSH